MTPYPALGTGEVRILLIFFSRGLGVIPIDRSQCRIGWLSWVSTWLKGSMFGIPKMETIEWE
jgi:hypothetical protein